MINVHQTGEITGGKMEDMTGRRKIARNENGLRERREARRIIHQIVQSKEALWDVVMVEEGVVSD